MYIMAYICTTTYIDVCLYVQLPTRNEPDMFLYGQSYTYHPCLPLGSCEGIAVDGLSAMEIFMAYLESGKQLHLAQQMIYWLQAIND